MSASTVGGTDPYLSSSYYGGHQHHQPIGPWSSSHHHGLGYGAHQQQQQFSNDSPSGAPGGGGGGATYGIDGMFGPNGSEQSRSCFLAVTFNNYSFLHLEVSVISAITTNKDREHIGRHHRLQNQIANNRLEAAAVTFLRGIEKCCTANTTIITSSNNRLSSSIVEEDSILITTPSNNNTTTIIRATNHRRPLPGTNHPHNLIHLFKLLDYLINYTYTFISLERSSRRTIRRHPCLYRRLVPLNRHRIINSTTTTKWNKEFRD